MKPILFIALISFNLVGYFSNELVKIYVPKVDAQSGQEVSIRIFVSVKSGYHIQAHEVADELIIPTTLEITGDSNIAVGKLLFPHTKRFMLTGADDYLEVYDGEFEIETSLTMTDRIQKGDHQLMGKLKYQACDSVRCLFPRTIEFLINVNIN